MPGPRLSISQRFAVVLSYVGTGYCGWQSQGKASGSKPSVQSTLEKTLRRMTHEKISVIGSGRTDSGVHASGQVAHFTTTLRQWEPGRLRAGMNSLLPYDVRVLCVSEVPPDFHAQKNAEKKQYSYYVQQGVSDLPHMAPYSWWIRKDLNVSAMNDGIRHLVGKHDFKIFQAAGSSVKTTVREVFEADVTVRPIDFPGLLDGARLIRIRLVGSGFLKQMVRAIAGTLVDIGEERRPPEDMRVLLESRNRRDLGATAPGRGLWLERVWYPHVHLTGASPFV